MSKRGMCHELLAVSWADDYMRCRLNEIGMRDQWWVFHGCSLKRGHFGRCFGTDHPVTWYRNVFWKLKRKAFPLKRWWHKQLCKRNHHRLLPMSDGSDPCIWCDLVERKAVVPLDATV